MTAYFFALLAPIVLLPLIPFFARIVTAWFVNRPDGERGMTLVEILVALPIIAIGLLALLAVIPQAASNIQIGNTVSIATFLANARLDQAKAQPYRGVYDAAGACLSADASAIAALVGTEASVPGFVDYARTTTVTADPGACPLQQVVVSVAYRGRQQAQIVLQVAPR